MAAGTQAAGALPVSAEAIARRHFHSSPPTEAEVEDAINDIEDRIMENPGLAGRGVWLVTDDGAVVALVGRHLPGPRVPRDEVEGLFTRYALRSMGRSAAHDDLPVSSVDYALLLILREILHHYDFAGIELVTPV